MLPFPWDAFLWSFFPMSFVAATVVAVTPMSDVVFVDDGKNVLAIVDATSWVGITSAGF